MSSTTQESTASDRRNAYERVTETIKRQTGGRRRPTASLRHIRVTAVSHGSLEPEEFESALRAAIENNDVARIGQRVCLAEPDALRAVIQRQAELDEPDRAVIGTLNTWIDQLDDDRDDQRGASA